MKVKVKGLYAQPLATNDVLVYFDIEDITVDPKLYKFEIHRSLDSKDNWAKIAVLENQQQHLDTFRDVDKSVFKSGNIHVYYKIHTINTSTWETWDSDPILASYSASDTIANALRYKYDLVLNKKSGSDALYLVARKHGFRCPECWNDTMKTSVKSNCEACFGTGYYKGYYKPFRTKIQFSKKVVDKSSVGGFQDESTPVSIIMGSYPMAGMDDVIFEIKRNRFMKILRAAFLDHTGNVYAQQLMAINIPKTSEIARYVTKKYMEMES